MYSNDVYYYNNSKGMVGLLYNKKKIKNIQDKDKEVRNDNFSLKKYLLYYGG